MPEIHDLTQEVQTIELLKERFYIGHKISPEILSYDIRMVRDYFDNFSESLLLELKTAVAMEKKKDVCEFQFPETLWQFIKKFYLPKFFRRWFPIKYATLKVFVDLDVKYLDIPVFLQEKEPRIFIRALNMVLPKYKMLESDVKVENIAHPEVETKVYKYEDI